MKKSILVRYVLATAVLLGLLVAVNGGLAIRQSDVDVDAIVQKLIAAKSVPGVGVAVVKDGNVVVAKGYGLADIDGGVAANESTVFQIASVTKQFTATGVMMLVETGKLKLEDTLGKYVRDVPQKWSGVTLRQLLNQVSGIPNYPPDKLINNKSYTKSELLAVVKDVPPRFEPGTQWEYSNTNYFLLGMVIEKASGKSYPDYMLERIFKPLGMTSTVINTSGLKIGNAAVGYSFGDGVWKKVLYVDPSQPFAAGAVVSTAADMAKWALAQGDARLLKKTSWDQIWASGKLPDGRETRYGFGWQLANIGETSYLNHGGGIPGFSSFIARFPNDNLTVVVLVNGESRVPQPLALNIAALYLPKVAAALTAQRAARNASPIEDTDGETTKFLRATFEKMLAGEVNPDVQKVIFPNNVNQLRGQLGSQGPIKSFDLMRVENTAEGK